MKAASGLADKGKKKVDHMVDVLSGNYAKKVDTDYNRYEEDFYNRVNRSLGAGSAADRKWQAYVNGDTEAYNRAQATLDRNSEITDKDLEGMERARSKQRSDDYQLSKSINNTKRAISDAASKLKGSASSAVSSAQSKANAALKDAQALAADVRELAAENVRYYTNKDYRNLSNAADSLGRQLDSLDDSIAEASKYPEAATVVRTLQQQRWMISQQLNQAEQQLDNMRNKK